MTIPWLRIKTVVHICNLRMQKNSLDCNCSRTISVNKKKVRSTRNADLAAALRFELLVKLFLLAPDQIVYSKPLCLVSLLHNIGNNNENDEALE